jgi:hypothetical protein
MVQTFKIITSPISLALASITFPLAMQIYLYNELEIYVGLIKIDRRCCLFLKRNGRSCLSIKVVKRDVYVQERGKLLSHSRATAPKQERRAAPMKKLFF